MRKVLITIIASMIVGLTVWAGGGQTFGNNIRLLNLWLPNNTDTGIYLRDTTLGVLIGGDTTTTDAILEVQGDVAVIGTTTSTVKMYSPLGEFTNLSWINATGTELVLNTKDVGNYIDFWNGTFTEFFDALIQSDGATASTTIEKTGGGDLTMRFSDGDSTLDCTPKCAIALTAGSDVSPQSNYIYIPQSTKALTKSTTNWPATEHIKVQYSLCPSLATIQSDGSCYINQNWNDDAIETNSMGHVATLGKWIRRQGAVYFSGIDPNGATGYLTVGAGTVYFKSTSGIISQLHEHAYPAKDTSAGDDMHIVNYPATAYKPATNLYTGIDKDSTGATIGLNQYFNFVVWGVANKGSDSYEPLMANLPSCTYANLANAQGDVDGCDNFTMPRQFKLDSSTGFLIARITARKTATTWTRESAVDLRGQTPSTATGATGAVTTNFADDQFTIFDEINMTKIGAFDIGTNVTAGNTRTIKWPDADGTMCLLDLAQTWTATQTMQTLLPSANNTYTLGNTSLRWKGLYTSEDIIMTGSRNIITDTGLTFIANSQAINWNSTAFYPQTSAQRDLGKTGGLWRDLWLSRNLTDGTNSVSVAGAKSAYDYSQVGHLPLTGGIVTGSSTASGLTMQTSTTTGNMYIPVGATQSMAVAGQIGIDTTSDQFKYFGGAERVLPYKQEKCFTVQTPVVGDDNVPIWSPDHAITITNMYCRVQGGTNWVGFLSDGTNALDSMTCIAGGQADDGTIANATFTANERVEFDTTSISGTVDWINYCFTYTITAD